MAYKKKLPIPLDEIRSRYLAGESRQDLAELTGLSPQTIGRRLREAGVILRSRGANTEELRRGISERRRAYVPEYELRELHSYDMSCREMASVLGWEEEAIRQRLIELGLPRLPAKARPEKNYFWQGGYIVDFFGYIRVHAPDHPRNNQGYVQQHRLVMEGLLGRLLTPEEVVHHRNEDKSDNRPENLQLFASNGEHIAHHCSMKKEKLPKEERERLRQEDVRRAYQRVAAILAGSGNDAGQSP